MAVPVISKKPTQGGGGLGSIIGSILGGVGGFVVGGPAGAVAGAGLGNQVGGSVGGVADPAKPGVQTVSNAQDSPIQRRLAAMNSPDRLTDLRNGLDALKMASPEMRSQVAPGLLQAYVKELKTVDPSALSRMAEVS